MMNRKRLLACWIWPRACVVGCSAWVAPYRVAMPGGRMAICSSVRKPWWGACWSVSSGLLAPGWASLEKPPVLAIVGASGSRSHRPEQVDLITADSA
jgi:hypothetical protein